MKSDLASKFLIGFAHVLRHQGFLASADQSISFLSATQALGPKSLADIRRAAQAIFAPPPEHRDIFNELRKEKAILALEYFCGFTQWCALAGHFIN